MTVASYDARRTFSGPEAQAATLTICCRMPTWASTSDDADYLFRDGQGSCPALAALSKAKRRPKMKKKTKTIAR
jgi:hypothetical protein